MNATNLQLQIEAMAVVARVEGMKAQNAKNAALGEYPEYDFAAFEVYAFQLDNIRDSIDREP